MNFWKEFSFQPPWSTQHAWRMATRPSSMKNIRRQPTDHERMPKSRTPDQKKTRSPSIVDEGVKYHSTRPWSMYELLSVCMSPPGVCVSWCSSRPQIRLSSDDDMTRKKIYNFKNIYTKKGVAQMKEMLFFPYDLETSSEEFQILWRSVEGLSHLTFREVSRWPSTDWLTDESCSMIEYSRTMSSRALFFTLLSGSSFHVHKERVSCQKKERKRERDIKTNKVRVVAREKKPLRGMKGHLQLSEVDLDRGAHCYDE